jgi:hypothetical protein
LAVAHDLAASDGLDVAVQPCGLERRTIGKRHVTVEAVDPYRVIRRDGINPVATRQLAAPQCVIPVTTGNPCARWNALGVRLDACRELLRGVRVAQFYGAETESAIKEVDVRIDESRRDERAAQVDDLRTQGCLGLDFRGVADCGDAIAGNSYRYGLWTRAITGPHPSVHQDERNGRCRNETLRLIRLNAAPDREPAAACCGDEDGEREEETKAGWNHLGKI